MDNSNLVGSLYVQCFLCAMDGVDQRSFRRWAFDDRFFRAYPWPPLREAASVRGSARPIQAYRWQMPGKRRSEDVDSKRLSKGQKRLLVWRKRMMKCEGEATEFWID